MLIFRNATKTDIAAIANLHAKSWQENYRNSFSEDFLDNQVHLDRMTVWKNRLKGPQENQHVILAEDSGHLIGFICLYFEDDALYGTLLDNLHVSSIAKGKGIGTSLMHSAVSAISRRDLATGLYLWVLDNNTDAIKFYEGLGGVMVEKVEADDIGDKSFIKLRYYWDSMPSLLTLLETKKKKQ